MSLLVTLATIFKSASPTFFSLSVFAFSLGSGLAVASAGFLSALVGSFLSAFFSVTGLEASIFACASLFALVSLFTLSSALVTSSVYFLTSASYRFFALDFCFALALLASTFFKDDSASASYFFAVFRASFAGFK